VNANRLRYHRALTTLDDVIVAFPDHRWDDDTPCAEWTARMLAGHVIDGQLQVAAMVRRRPRPPVREPGELARIAGSSPVVAWRGARAEVEGALDSTPEDAAAKTPTGEQTVDTLLATAIVEPLVHSWDLATTAGIAVDLDDDAVQSVLALVERIGDSLAATGMYATARAVDDAMTESERLLALTGRDPAACAYRR
jgi:uncharacterized protein (TIGR03086 family)